MDIKAIQLLISQAGSYNGPLDNKVSDDLLKGAKSILERHIAECVTDPRQWPSDRQLVGAAQLILQYAGYEPGKIDGYAGHNTNNAFAQYEAVKAGKNFIVDRDPKPDYVAPEKKVFPLQSECRTFYGDPSANTVAQYLVTIEVPYTLRIDYNLDQTTKKMTLHSKCADSAVTAMELILKEYGINRIHDLGLDRFAGSYNRRLMRGGTSWSMHAYGCAIDWFAGPNGLNTHAPEALFSKPDYKEFFDIWESVGWVSLGRAIDRDYMHVQAARLK
ncbi:putative endolysin protein [Rhizobium phage RHph_Y1_11]|nr:putative endolysin protein [Rhizobium phage RHph_Y1_11]